MLNPLLKQLADNNELLEAVKAHIKERFQFDVGNMPVNMGMQELGMFVTTRMEGLQLVEQAFIDINKLKNPTKQEGVDNPVY
jgi:hypothetical protein